MLLQTDRRGLTFRNLKRFSQLEVKVMNVKSGLLNTWIFVSPISIFMCAWKAELLGHTEITLYRLHCRVEQLQQLENLAMPRYSWLLMNEVPNLTSTWNTYGSYCWGLYSCIAVYVQLRTLFHQTLMSDFSVMMQWLIKNIHINTSLSHNYSLLIQHINSSGASCSRTVLFLQRLLHPTVCSI